MDLNQLRQKAISSNVPIIKPEAEQVLIKYLNKYKPTNVVEIGSAIGYSSLVIARTIQDWT